MRSEGYCSWVCVSVCLLSHISPMERLFVLKSMSRTQRATKVEIFVGFSLKPLRCRDPALPALYAYARSAIFLRKARMRIVVFTTWWTAAAISLVCVSVCLSVCLSTTILALQATRRLMSDTNSFGATRA